MVLSIPTGYRVLGNVYLNQLKGIHNSHISYQNNFKKIHAHIARLGKSGCFILVCCRNFFTSVIVLSWYSVVLGCTSGNIGLKDWT